MNRCVVNVATGSYVQGQRRLKELLPGTDKMFWTDCLPAGCPIHRDTPYAFKAFAIESAAQAGADVILWADACIVPVGLDRLWALIEKQGYWFSDNGYRNDEWTCDAAYPLLGVTKEENHSIRHVAATAFGLNLCSEIGREFASEYSRLAQNGAFRGPWTGGIGIQHRHDQTAASVICHRLGMELTDPPNIFAYRGGETEETVLIADGNYQ